MLERSLSQTSKKVNHNTFSFFVTSEHFRTPVVRALDKILNFHLKTFLVNENKSTVFYNLLPFTKEMFN